MDYGKKLREIINSNSEYYPSEDKAVFAKYFPELKESKDERIRKAIIDYLKIHYEGSTIGYGVQVKEVIAWLEKQGEKKPNSQMEKCGKCQFVYTGYCNGTCILKNNEQKPANKVEPKFKVGDWVVNNVCLPMQIASIKDDMYVFTKGDAMSVLFIDGNYHLWSIQDAEDGDVLVNGSNIFIFHYFSDTRLMGYCHVNIDDGRFYDDLGKNECFCLIDAVVNPATKEQRELLFQKMKEAGYDWDADKKELKKIEVASKESKDEKQTDKDKKEIRRDEVKKNLQEYRSKTFSMKDLVDSFSAYIDKKCKNGPRRWLDIDDKKLVIDAIKNGDWEVIFNLNEKYYE